MVTAAGGMPSTVSTCTTREDGLSTETTYSVAVGESDCTGARLEYVVSGPKEVDETVVAPATACALFTTHTSLPSTAAKPSQLLEDVGREDDDAVGDAEPRLVGAAACGERVHAPVAGRVGAVRDGEHDAARSSSEIDANQRPLDVSQRMRGSVSPSAPVP